VSGVAHEVQPDVVVRGVESIKRRGRWLELELDDGRLIAFDPVDVVGCEASRPMADPDDARLPREESLTVYLRGRECELITDVDARALWAIVTEATR
jgi:hypothetical protein